MIGIKVFFLLLVVFSPLAFCDIVVDGRLNEKQWLSAKRFTNFKTTFPETGEKPELLTEAWFFQNKKGIYIGFKNEQPLQDRTRIYNRRDKTSSADYNEFVVDFTGKGSSAYMFVCSLAGGILDGNFVSGNQKNLDWDGIWYSAVHEDDKFWYSELFIPWHSVTYLPNGDSNSSTIKVWFNRRVASLGQSYSFPFTHSERESFIRELEGINVGHVASDFHWNIMPQLTNSYDFERKRDDAQFGLDFLLKPSSNKSLSMTLNPDFGIAESDELVSNYTPIETLHSEKRVFFAENHSVFDVKDDEFFVALNTRRIGSEADSDNFFIPKISHALKYTQLGEDTQIGALYAVEDKERDVKGKQFYSLRGLMSFEQGYIGNISNFVDRPQIDREATTSIVDSAFWLGDWLINGYTLYSNIIDKNVKKDGFGNIITVNHSPTIQLNNYIKFTWLDDKIDLDDAGYLERNDFRELQFYQNYTLYFDNTDVSLIEFEYGGDWSRNKQGEGLSDEYLASAELAFKNSSYFLFEVLSLSSGIDDLITFGNGSVKLPGKDEYFMKYTSPSASRFQYQFSLKYFQEGLQRWAHQWELHNKYSVTDKFIIDIRLLTLKSDDWLIGSDEGELKQYQRSYREADVSILYSVGNHEITGRVQWNGLNARATQRYRVENLELKPNDKKLADFARSDLSFQLRYLYRINHLSKFYLIYSHNGSLFEQNRKEIDFGSQFNDTFFDANERLLTMKVKFGIF